MKARFAKGIQVEVLVGRTPQKEYPNPDPVVVHHHDPDVVDWQTDSTISSYIASVEDQHFSIKLSLGPPATTNMLYSKIKYYVKIDGIDAMEFFFERAKILNKNNKYGVKNVYGEKSGYGSKIVEGVQEGKGRGCKERKFEFKKITSEP